MNFDDSIYQKYTYALGKRYKEHTHTEILLERNGESFLKKNLGIGSVKKYRKIIATLMKKQ